MFTLTTKNKKRITILISGYTFFYKNYKILNYLIGSCNPNGMFSWFTTY